MNFWIYTKAIMLFVSKTHLYFQLTFHLSQIAYLKNSNFSLHECESIHLLFKKNA